MTPAAASRGAISVIATILVMGALYLGQSVFEPVAFALFIVALVAPLQARLKRRLPAGLALLATLLVTLAVLGGLILIFIWSLGELAHWTIQNIPRFQASYAEAVAWLEGHEIFVPGSFSARFDPMWIVGPSRIAAANLGGAVSFLMLALVFLLLGLKEVDSLPGRVRAALGTTGSWDPVKTGLAVAAKFRLYMRVRSIASALTGLGTLAVAWLLGIEQPLAWGVMAFALNFVPFIGPLIVVGLMTIFAAAQFIAWQQPLAVLVLVTLVQFGIGSYLEPILAGKALAISPFMVLLAVFFWGFLWEIPGAFLGVPITIMLVTIFQQQPDMRWLAALMAEDDGGD